MDKRIAVRRRKIKRGIYNVVYVPVRYSPLLALEVHFALLQNKLCKRRGNANGYIAHPVPRLRLCRAERIYNCVRKLLLILERAVLIARVFLYARALHKYIIPPVRTANKADDL